MKLRVIAIHQFLDIMFDLLVKEMGGESATEFIQRALKRSRYSQDLVKIPAERMAVPQAREVSFQWKNPDFVFRNPDLLIRNLDFLLKNVDCIM